MTPTEVEAYLKNHFPGRDWVMFDKSFGLPMLDGIMLYARYDGQQPLDILAQQVIAMADGKMLP